MVPIELAPRERVKQKVITETNGFAVLVASEVPYDHTRFLFAEGLRNFSRESRMVQGWRIYFTERDSQKHQEDQMSAMLTSDQWFALHVKGSDVIGMYFPKSTDVPLLLAAADAYFRSSGALVDVPEQEFFNLTEKYNVSNPYSGKPEFCLDLIVGAMGRAKINGMRVRD